MFLSCRATSLWDLPWSGLLGGHWGLQNSPKATTLPVFRREGLALVPGKKPFMFGLAPHNVTTQTMRESVAFRVVPAETYFFSLEIPLPKDNLQAPVHHLS